MTAVPPVSMALDDQDPQAFAAALGASFRRFGFAVVCDHGLDQGVIEAALGRTKAFFALPEAVKRKYKLPVSGQRGYTLFGVETAKGATHHDLKEFWHMGRDLPPGHRFRATMADNVWPAEIPSFHHNVGWLYGALDSLGVRVLKAEMARLDAEDEAGEADPTPLVEARKQEV